MVYYKRFSYRRFSESPIFIFPLLALFFICCFFGSFLSWFFLSSEWVFFRGFDYLFGLALFFGGCVSYFFLKLPFYLLHFFSWIMFLRWISSGGVSKAFRGLGVYLGDSSWLEFTGGKGVYNVLFFVNPAFVFLVRIGLMGSFGFVVFFLIFVFCALSWISGGFEGASD